MGSNKDIDDDDVSDSSFEADSETGESAYRSESRSDNDFREVQNLTRKETKNVETWREMVTGIMVIAACFVTITCFIYLSRDETDTFRQAFHAHVTSMTSAVSTQRKEIQEAFETLSDSITIHAQTSEQPWPFVTVPFFEVQGSHARDIAVMDFVSFCPLVEEAKRAPWEVYSQLNQWWLEGDQVDAMTRDQKDEILQELRNKNESIPANIYEIQDDRPTSVASKPLYSPRWQISPPPTDLLFVNYDVLSGDNASSLFEFMVTSNGPVLSQVLTESHSLATTINSLAAVPSSLMFFPVYETFNRSADGIVGFLEVLFDWNKFLSSLLPEEAGGVYYILNNDCGDQHTFEVGITGNMQYLGKGDLHDILYDRHIQTVVINPKNGSYFAEPCSYFLDVYPTAELRHEFATVIPGLFTGVVAAFFFLMAFFFFTYDQYVQHRNEVVVRQAAKTSAIVSSLFPTNVRERLFGGRDGGSVRSGRSSITGGSKRLKTFLLEGTNKNNSSQEDRDTPIADLFPACTVLFADIVGFTAWSSMREPTQVFRLLESIYAAFDEIAKRRKVFKVETIGDCYVAVTGLPEPTKHHAVVMAKFARDCMYKMHEVTRNLEVMLGPDTGDLSMRFGLHSGPVTAGVLRGERSRFQLFGDTVNTAARMESTGKKGFIHLSHTTADEITTAGKSSWIRERADKVTAKGKGEMTTYWLSLGEHSSCGDGVSSCDDASRGFDLYGGASAATPVDTTNRVPNLEHQKSSYFGTRKSRQEQSGKTQRLIEWNVDVLLKLLKQIAAKRQIMKGQQNPTRKSTVSFDPESAKPQMVLEEVVEVITLPKFTSKVAGVVRRAEGIVLSSDVQLQLMDFVTVIAEMYHDNPFHNFEHASHVTMSVVKLLSRIVAPVDLEDEDNYTNEKALMKTMASKMHDHTYGITSDPLTQFAIVFAALIHDVDHDGVTNAQLVKEGTKLAERYKGKSVAEQNSVDLAWHILMQPEYEALRKAICNCDADFKRFRQLVVNSVMATDIVDKELKEARNARWDKAFKGNFREENPDTDRNRKATIVLEHLIQASDVSHTMQHWHIYRKWNERLFLEMYRAYKEGRAAADPSEFWYKGEIGFFDFYIIPLAKKLEQCGVFGVSSHEYLSYAQQNLEEWKTKGEQVVAEMIEKVKLEYGEVQGGCGERRRELFGDEC